ncbi:MAG TPA: DUF881 domain-containing protein [Micromonosporaceae bacterium]|nr:DUF881 domain-containing protein [Micromonosporaceae bacterium]
MTRPERPGSRFGADLFASLFQESLDPAYAAAARRRTARPPVPLWRRAAGRAVSLVTLFAVGLLFAVAYRQVVADEPESARVRAGLADEVRSRRAQTDGLQERADRLRAEVAALRDAALAGEEAASLRNLEAAAGLAKVAGDGVVVRVADGPDPADPVTGAPGDNLGRVLDRDLQDIVNSLWLAGAEAVAVNGQRLTATSTIRAAGSAILVDFKPVSSPYEVSAIGPGELARRFNDSATARRFRRYVTAYGMAFDVRPRDDLTLPAAADPQLRYARPQGASPPTSSAGPAPTPSPSGGR